MKLSCVCEVIRLGCHAQYISLLKWTFTATEELSVLNKRQWWLLEACLFEFGAVICIYT